MRTKNKANTRGKAIGKEPITLEQEFASIQEAYELKCPHLIKERIMWRYIKMCVVPKMAEREIGGLKYHDRHYTVCNLIIEKRRGVGAVPTHDDELRVFIDNESRKLFELLGTVYRRKTAPFLHLGKHYDKAFRALAMINATSRHMRK